MVTQLRCLDTAEGCSFVPGEQKALLWVGTGYLGVWTTSPECALGGSSHGLEASGLTKDTMGCDDGVRVSQMGGRGGEIKGTLPALVAEFARHQPFGSYQIQPTGSELPLQGVAWRAAGLQTGHHW